MMTEESGEAAPRIDIALLIQLMVYVSHELGSGLPQDDPLLDRALRAIAMRLNRHYQREGAPYGNADAGFWRWLYERWPAPPAA